MEFDDELDLRSQAPQEPCAAIDFIAAYFRHVWRVSNNRPSPLHLQSLDHQQIENVSQALRIVRDAHERISAPVVVPDDVIAPFEDEMRLSSDVYTFVTRQMPLEAKKYLARTGMIDEGNFFEGTLPEPVFELEDDQKQELLNLSGDLRKLVNESQSFSPDVQVALLHHLTKFDNELHRQTGRTYFLQGVGKTFIDWANYKPSTDAKSAIEIMELLLNKTSKRSKDFKALPEPEKTLGLPAPEECSTEDEEQEDTI